MSLNPRSSTGPDAADRDAPRFAARCRYLRVTYDLARGHDLVNLCTHIVREGADCVGPFLDDTETNCGLFEHRD